MIEKGEVLKQVFLKLGENTKYNDNGKELYKVCGAIFDTIVDNIAFSTAFLFNATTVKLTTASKRGDEYKFNIPIDFLNILRCDKKYRIENEFIYSPENEIKIQYCRKIDLTEFPDNTFYLLVAMTAREMALAYNTYNSRFELLEREVYKYRNDLISQQGFQYWEV